MAVLNANVKAPPTDDGFSKGNGGSSYTQDPIAVIGMACRLPGQSSSPQALWDFLERGGIAGNSAPETRYNLKTHHDGSHKPNTMRPPGGMYLEYVDPQDFDAPFFNISRTDAIAMDPQQRQLLEVVYEGLENAGITLEALDGAPVACFVGSYAVDYADMHNRDPEDRPLGIAVGVGRAILSNRISHFLNIKGPSATIDTACSASLQGIDIACRYLQSREITGAIVAGANMYLSPEHVMDSGSMKTAHSLSGRCHTFDKKADGYIKAEAVNTVILKRLDDALRDGDPIRAIIRGIATNSDGRTPGIASPSSEAQANAIRAAYANAGISDFGVTSYLECHGTGTQAGDPIEVKGAASVFAPTRSIDKPLRIGSIKSNVGHAEPAAGISGLLKTILSIEKGIIPGNPTFDDPNPAIDFEGLKVCPMKATTPWPDVPYRRASVNSFGYGGSNAHVILDEASSFLGKHPDAQVSSYLSESADMFAEEEEEEQRPVTLVFSANDEKSLRAYCSIMSKHLINPRVNIKLPDLAYTLSERRTHHFHRAYVVTQDSTKLNESALVFGKKSLNIPKIGFVFTGQGAQWPQMGKALVETFPSTRELLKRLDSVLASLPDGPSWSLLDELIEPRKSQHLRQPEFSQPLVTALQLALLDIFTHWGIKPQAVVGHSSGEIAAAFAAGYLTQEEAIKIAFYRGRAAVLDQAKASSAKASLGMLAVGLGSEAVQEYIHDLYPSVQIGCFNSPNSVTLSGDLSGLETAKARLEKDSCFARLLQVDLAYHSKFMDDIGECYLGLLQQHSSGQSVEGRAKTANMYSSVTGHKLERACDPEYWKSNMISPVRFDQAIHEMLATSEGPDFLIEIGPSGALAGPITQIKDKLPSSGSQVQYCTALVRGKDSTKAMFDVAGRLFISGWAIDFAKVNSYEPGTSQKHPSVVFDLPNYAWNHSTKYWHESDASKDWRFRRFPHHDLLGGKVLATSWDSPSYRKIIRLEDLPWLRDHRMGTDCLMPASGFISMAIEALFQSRSTLDSDVDATAADELCYRLRDVKFDKALVLEENLESRVMLNLSPHSGPKDSWYDFKVSSSTDGVWSEHCSGIIRLEKPVVEVASEEELAPLKHTASGVSWYKAANSIGYGFGPAFQKQIRVESIMGKSESRSHVSLTEPTSAFKQSRYPMHPACIDGCFQTVTPSLWNGDRSAIDTVLVPAIIDDLVINKVATQSHPEYGVSITKSRYSGRGRMDEKRNFNSNCSVYDPETGALLLRLSGLRYHKLDTGLEIGAAHTLTRSMWKPDITFMSQIQLASTDMAAEQTIPSLHHIVDLIAHKKPTLKVMEIDLGSSETSSIWFQENFEASSTTRAAYSQYAFICADPNSLIAMQEDLERHRNSTFDLLDITKPEFVPSESEFDLIIVKSDRISAQLLELAAKNIRKLLLDGGYTLIIQSNSLSADSGSGSEEDIVVIDSVNGLDQRKVTTILDIAGFHRTTKLTCDMDVFAYLSVAEVASSDAPVSRTLVATSLTYRPPIETKTKSALETAGWEVLEYSYPAKDIPAKSIVIIQDELFNPVIASITADQWEQLKNIISLGCQILWITKGSQMEEVSKPDNALIHGMFRTIRAEDPSLRLVTLDLDSNSNELSVATIIEVLERLRSPASKTNAIDHEYVERRGFVYVNRIVPDARLNQLRQDESRGSSQAVIKSLGDMKVQTSLRAERLGSLDALQYVENSAIDSPVSDGHIEVKLIAAGLNFKDVIVSQGIVPENEHLLGLEGSGIVTRVGKGAGKFKIGDRVAMLTRPTFANKVQCPIERAHLMPWWLSFEEAATIPLVYLTSIYSLFDVGNLKKGQSILIHSAAGGMGIACIHLAQYVGAEIFVTVGTNEKREFLKDSFNIPESRMFSSRTKDFAREILIATRGKGIDLIINSLVGDLLDESWRICADGGTMVEIGKKDIIDRNHLSMEPFDRNCSFRPVDFSYKQISNNQIAATMSLCFDLLQAGHIKPIRPITTFGFDKIPAAFAYMRSGKHIGKMVITDGESGITSQVPIRPAMRQLVLQGEVSYMIVGGLRGLCGSLAVHLASKGAKHIIAMSRSGISDKRSQGIVKNCNALGCEVQEVKADVAIAEDVEHAFKVAAFPVAGIIQGAMVLRDKPYETMTVSEFHTTISSKVQGTWNLHNSAQAHASPVTFFTLLSSISGVLGQKGQANYAAANVFMDSFASYRQSLNLPANSLNLGVIEDVGYVAEQGGMSQHFDDKLWTGINETMLRRFVNYSIFQQTRPIDSDSSAQLITGISVPQPADSDLARDARFSSLFMSASSSPGSASGKGASEEEKQIQAFTLLHKAKSEESTLVQAMVQILNKQFMKTLRLTEDMEQARSLSAYGLDSLSAVEVRNWIRINLGTEVTTLDITNAGSLWSLGEKVVGKLPEVE